MLDFELTQGEPDDARAIAEVWQESRVVSLPFLPVLHTLEEIEEFWRERELQRSVVWVAKAQGRVVGLMAREDEWIHHLYIHPELQSAGVGSALLAKAMEEHPDGLRLYTFQENLRARAFYEMRGFTNLEFNEAGGEEQLPDVLMLWTGGE